VRLHERTFDLAREQAEHRRGLETAVIGANLKAQLRGQWMAFAIVLGSLATGGLLIFAGRKVEGLWAMFAPLASVLWAFLFARSKQDRELERKRQELATPSIDSQVRPH
jgi:hypothetical protein